MKLGLDLGFRQNKSVNQNYSFKFPSLIGNPSAFELDQLSSARSIVDELIITVNDATYYVGNKAKETSNARLCTRDDKTNTDNDKMSFLAALSLHALATGCNTFDIITGLPVEELKTKGLKEQLIYNMKGTHRFQFGKEKVPMEINIRNVTVIPQSAGAYFDYILDMNGQIIKENIKCVKGCVVVIDVGYKTTDIVTMLNGRFVSEKSCTIVKGMRDIHKELARLIKLQYDRKFDLADMDDICRARRFVDKGVYIDISNLILKAEKPIAESIINESNAILGDTRSSDKVLGCGGTMNILSSYFEPFYRGYFAVLANSEYSNASGNYKFGVMNASNIQA